MTAPLWTDAHAHLAGLDDAELDREVDEARSEGVVAIVNTATNLDSCERVLAQAARVPSLPAAVGISPFDVERLPADWEERLRGFLSDDRVVACGETGIDATNPSYPPLSLQLPVYERQLQLAVGCGKTVVIHSRGTERRATELCVRAGVRRALFHCFTGTMDDLGFILDAGYCVSYSGIVTFARDPLREQVAATPTDRLLIETDAPYLAPRPHRGKPNRPAWLPLTAHRVAAIKGMEIADLARSTAGVCDRLFGHSAAGS